VISTRNRPTLLLQTIESVLRGIDVPTELIIVDQSDQPLSAIEQLTCERACDIRYLRNSTVGVSQGRNSGAQVARHSILVFTDDDMQATQSWYKTLIETLLQVGPQTVVTGQVLAPESDAPGAFAPSINGGRTPQLYRGRIGRDVLYSGNMALFRTAFHELGGFDERLGPGTPFPAAEDNDLGYRILERGYGIFFEPEAVLYHRNWRTKSDFLPLRWQYGRGQGAYYAKHLRWTDLHMARRLLANVKNHLLPLPKLLWSQPRLAWGHVFYLLGLISGAGKWLVTRTKLQYG